MVPVPTFEKVMVPVPTCEKLRFRFQLYQDRKKQIFQEKFWNFLAFLHSKQFYKEKVYNFQQIYCKM